MSITTLSTLIQGEHLPDYYVKLLEHHADIINHVKEHDQKTTAKELNMSTGKFSTVYKMIVAYSMIKGN